MSYADQIETLFETRMLVVNPSERALAEMEKFEELGTPPASFESINSAEEWQAIRTAYRDPVAFGLPPMPPFRQKWMDNGRARAESMLIDGPHGKLEMRMIVPEQEIKGALFHIHGGAWVLGDPSTFDDKYAQAADLCGLVVGSVNYRKAPEHPYPGPIDDCETAALWFNDHVKQRFGINNVLIHGISAGGQMSAVVALRMHLRHGYQYAGAVHEIGLYDFTNSLPSRTRVDGRCLGVDSKTCIDAANAFLPDTADRTDPDISPLYASNDQLEGLGPTLLTCCELDPLCDDSLLYFMRQLEAGNDAYLVVFNGIGHNLDTLECEEAELNVAVIAAFMSRCIA
ncbi:MAG: alpha/beta hydrolase [Caldilineaceae bacterium]|nr:alpha/beta hydrolase [Caldilineaceae bacterium]